MVNVMDFGAAADGSAPCDTAFAAAIAAVAAAGQAPNAAAAQLLGGVVRVPQGVYRLDHRLDVYGHAVLQGEGAGDGNSGTRLWFPTPLDGGVVLHSGATHPSGVHGGGGLRDLDIVGVRTLLPVWAPGVAYQAGAVVRTPGDNRRLLECVAAGTSGGALGVAHVMEGFDRPWTPNTRVPYTALRRAADGDPAWLFVCWSDMRPTGAQEPAWVRQEGQATLDGTAAAPVVWFALRSTTTSFYATDGGCLWRVKNHSGVLFLVPVRVERVSVSAFDGCGLQTYGNATAFPFTNSCAASARDVLVGSCGHGSDARGPDCNQVNYSNVTVITIGYEAAGLPAVQPGPLAGVGFSDNSFLGNTYVGCLAETCQGRAYACEGAAGRTFLLNCYSEANCQPSALTRTVACWSGQHAAGFAPGQEGFRVDIQDGVYGLPVRGDHTTLDAPLGGISGYVSIPGGLGGFWALTDAKQGGRTFCHRKGGFGGSGLPAWAYGFGLDTAQQGALWGYAGFDAPEGPGWIDRGRYLGASAAGYGVLLAPAARENDHTLRKGRRLPGDTFRGYFAAGGAAFTERVCTAAGWVAAQAWGPNTAWWAASPLTEAHLCRASTTGAVVFQCVRSGLGGASPPDFAAHAQPGSEFDDGLARWRALGPVATYGHSGRVEP